MHTYDITWGLGITWVSEPEAVRMRLIGMTGTLRSSLALLPCALFAGCTSVSSSGDDCVSHYEPVASAPTWDELKDAMLGYGELGRVASVRTQARGADVGAGDQDVVRVVDLLNRNGRRLAQVDVWRTDDRLRAGVWSQCID